MSTKPSAEFKAKIALEAFNLSVKELDALAEKHNISKEDVLTWVDELKANASSLFSDKHEGAGHHAPVVGEDVVIASDDADFIASLSKGANSDELNYKTLVKWSVLGIVTVVVIIATIIPLSQVAFTNAEQSASVNSNYEAITDLKASDAEKLNSFGVVDLDNGTYRIPIESAIDKIAND